MGKKGSWFSAIKRVFTHNSKGKPINGSDKKNSKEKKKGKGILTHGESKSFIPLFREPSSIEKILGEADQFLISHNYNNNNNNNNNTSSELPKKPPTLHGRPISPPRASSHRVSSPKVTSPRVSSPKVSSPRVSSPKVTSPRVSSPKVTSPRVVSPKAAAPPRNDSLGAGSSKAPLRPQSRKEISHRPRPEPTLRNQHLSATKIQAAYRGYLARRSFRALRGLVRLQGVVMGQNVKRQTMNAMKQMQLLVRVQTQIQSRRIQMLENQRQSYRIDDKEAESTLSKLTFNQLSESGHTEDWDDSALTKDEVDARLQKKVEAVMKRERAMAYASSHQGKLFNSNPKSTQSPLDTRSNGYPWWWNWLDRQLPPSSTSQNQPSTKNFTLTPPRPISDYKQTPRYPKHGNFTFDNQETPTPRSSRSTIPFRPKQFQTPNRTPSSVNNTGFIKYSKPRTSAANSAYNGMLKDDDSLVSCPPFSSVPNYMTPTVSAKAKVRPNSNPRERSIAGTPSNDSKRRFSFPLTPNIGSFKWNKGSKNDNASQKGLEKHRSSNSIGDLSIDSAISMPATVGGRKQFNRFV